MSTRRDRESVQNERIIQILTDLLKNEYNKHCIDCDAKGPRWASWNLGIFLCIRCAGIHRKLGVHISKVKSVNLDTWTPQQICMMQDIGNEVGRTVYEAHLPENFRRPQTDSALEQFMRAKYEEKRYIDRNWQPPKPRSEVISSSTGPSRPKKQPSSPIKAITTTGDNNSEERGGHRAAPLRTPGQNQGVTDLQCLPHTQSSPSVDLLGLNAPSNTLTLPTAGQHNAKTASADDLFGDFVSSEYLPSATASATGSQKTDGRTGTGGGSLLSSDLFGLQFEQQSVIESASSSSVGDQKVPSTKSTKESILALYGQAPPAPLPQQQKHAQSQLGSRMDTGQNFAGVHGGTGGWSDGFQSFQSGGGTATGGSTFGIEHNPFFAAGGVMGPSSVPVSGQPPHGQCVRPTQQAGVNQDIYLQQIQNKLSGLQMSGSNVMQGPSGWDQLNTPAMAASSGQTMSANLWQ